MRAIDRDEGPAVLVGPSGTGKTLLCQTLAAAYRNSMEVVLLGDAKLCTRRALLQMILFHLNMPYRDREEGELRLSLLDRLRPGVGESGRDGLLLIVDEAQHLAPRLIDELRMIAGVVRDGRPRVRMVLAGNMRFEERLSEPSLESLAQRVAARCYLHPMHLDETRIYLREHFRRIGLTLETLVEENAIQAVHQAAMGIPRVINQIMDQAFITAEQKQSQCIDLKIIETAWAELNQLPAPCVDEDTQAAMSEAPSAVVEFGSLDLDLPPLNQGEGALNANAINAYVSLSQSNEYEPDPDATVFETPAWTNKTEATKLKSETVALSQVKGPCRNGDDVECNGRGCQTPMIPAKTDSSVRKAVIEENYSAMAFSALESGVQNPLTPVDAISFLQQQLSLELGDDPWAITHAPILSDAYAQRLAPELASHDLPGLAAETKSQSATSREGQNGFSIRAFTETSKLSQPAKPKLRSNQSASAVFGSDFDEVIELKQPMRVSATGPLPWQGTIVDDATWLEQGEGDGVSESAEDLRQQVLSLSHEVQLASQASNVNNFDALLDGQEHSRDDRDLLIVEEEVQSQGPSLHTAATQAGCDLEYRDLFSRLRQG